MKGADKMRARLLALVLAERLETDADIAHRSGLVLVASARRKEADAIRYLIEAAK